MTEEVASQLKAVISYDRDGRMVAECIGCGDLTTNALVAAPIRGHDNIRHPLCATCHGQFRNTNGSDSDL